MGASRPRILIIGADGADPGLLARFMSDGKLPHLARLCAQGAWGRLLTTFPPVSPVAWMTCLTGAPPSAHGIRDFVVKSQDSYLPTIGLYNVRAGSDGVSVYTSRRSVPTLGEVLADAGRTAYILKVPGTFPPPPVNGGLVSGFGMPDLLGTFGVSAWYTTAPAAKRASAPEAEGLVQPLTPAGEGMWWAEIPGPQHTKCTLQVCRKEGEVRLSLGEGAGHTVAVLAPGDWSGWVRLTFEVPARGTVHGMCRFRLVSVAPTLELYRTSVQCTPDAPLFAFAQPPGFASRLEGLVGPYATLGMPSDMDGVRRGVVDADTFLQDAYANWEQQVEMTVRLAADPAWDLLMTHLFTIDNVQHLFWRYQDVQHPAYVPELAARYGGEIEHAYCWLDAQVGRLLDLVDEATTVMVVSDHGGAPVKRLVYLNSWLWSRGYLAPREAVDPGKVARLDWTRTRAVMFGTGGIWLNVQGREPQGIVPPGAPFEALCSEIADGLLAWCDPESGRPVVERVLRGEDVYGPDARQTGPDLIPAFHLGYGLGRGEGLGRVARDKPLIEPNTTAWSGGHEGPYLPSAVAGVVILAGPRARSGTRLENGRLQDIAPTVLDLLQIAIPPSMRGRSLV